MNAPVLPTPSLDDLIMRAIKDHDAVGKISAPPHIQPADEERIAAQAVEDAIDDWCADTGAPREAVPAVLVALVYWRVLTAGREAREAADQFDLFESRSLYEGAARHEARGELG